MKKAIIVLACAASLFAQEVPSIDTKIPCRVAFDEVKNVSQRDAATDRIYALVEPRIRALEGIPKEKRSGEQYETELKSCNLSVDLFKVMLERIELGQKYVSTQKDISRVKDSLIALWTSDAKSLVASLDKSQHALAKKDSLLAAQKAEADKRLEALRSKTISVYKDARGTILSMSDILFETGKADLKPELRENLAEIAGILKNLLTESTVIIEGHTDNVGTAAANLKLSEQRAKAVLQYLITRGVDKKRLKSVGYGLTKPVDDNSTEEGRAKNRRVELVIKDK